MENVKVTPKVVKIGSSLYSVHHHAHKRVIVRIRQEKEKIHFCEHAKCVMQRATVIRGNDLQFECKHINLALEAIKDGDNATKDSYFKRVIF